MKTMRKPQTIDEMLANYSDEAWDIITDRVMSVLAAFNARHASDNGDDVPDRYDMRDPNDQEGWR